MKRLVEKVRGKTVIIFDHGNLVNDRLDPFSVRQSGHPTKLHAPELIEVPWLVVPDERREIEPEG